MRPLLRALRPAAATALLSGGAWASYKRAQRRHEPLWRFGVIADIQYCDCADAANFAGTEVRKYRGTLPQTTRAVSLWNSLVDDGLVFVANLGDLIDGQNAGGYGAGLSFAEPQSGNAFEKVVRELKKCRVPLHSAIGNHELYNFDWDGLRDRLQLPELGWRVAADVADVPVAPTGAVADAAVLPTGAPVFHYSWRPAAGWTMIMTNSYAVSLEQDKQLPGYAAAMALVAQHNPQCAAALAEGNKQVDFFAGVKNERDLRFVPFNGGLGSEQLAWLRGAVREAAVRGDRIVVFGHVPMLTAAASPRTLLYDAEEALDILHEEGHGKVVAVVCGHLHRGGYAVDSHGTHHVTLQSPLNFEDCFGVVDVYADRLELVGSGEMKSYSMPFPKTS